MLGLVRVGISTKRTHEAGRQADCCPNGVAPVENDELISIPPRIAFHLEAMEVREIQIDFTRGEIDPVTGWSNSEQARAGPESTIRNLLEHMSQYVR